MNKKARVFSFIFTILLLYILIFFFVISLYNYQTSITGKVAFFPSGYSKTYLQGEKLQGTLKIELKEGNIANIKDLIPANATLEVWVDNENVKNFTFAELVALSNQADKGNFTYSVFRNVNGLAPAQKGWGFSTCAKVQIPPQPSPPSTTLAAYQEQPAGKFLEECSEPNAQRQKPCPDEIHSINQRCICYAGINGGKCYWQPSVDVGCGAFYTCENFYDAYEINLSKLDIPVEDKNGDGNVKIEFRLVYRWKTIWNYADSYCIGTAGTPGPPTLLGEICNMQNYAANWSPVCGKDNVTYPNACFARCQGTTQVNCQGECPCPVPPPPSNINLAAQSQPSKPIKIHEVEILSKGIDVSVYNLPQIECDWSYTCYNSREYNRTQKVWMMYEQSLESTPEDRCIVAMCVLNSSLPECNSNNIPPPIKDKITTLGTQSPIKIKDKCEECTDPIECPPMDSQQPWRFSIKRCDYARAIEKLKEATSFIKVLPDDAELNGNVDVLLRNCQYGCSGNRCATSGGGGGGNGGGGGGYYPCFPNWTCSNWGSCQSDGYKYRTCIDTKNCTADEITWWISTGCGGDQTCIDAAQKPNEAMPCTLPCQEDWSCSAWSECDTETGLQHRNCVDLNNCGTQYNKPAETQTCQISYQPPGKEMEEKKPIEWWKWLIPSLLFIIILAAIIISIIISRRKPSPLGEEIFEEKPSKAISKEVPSELLAYIKQGLSMGASRQEIEQKLKQAGWPQDLIDAAFEQV